MLYPKGIYCYMVPLRFILNFDLGSTHTPSMYRENSIMRRQFLHMRN